MFVTLGAVGIVGFILVIRVNAGAKPAGAKPPEPATVAKPVKEAELNVITLTPEAVTRLDLKTATVTREQRARTRTFPGEVMPPPGRSVIVTAPLAGTVKPPATSAAAQWVAPGARLTADAPVLGLVPELSGEARATIATALVDADGQLKNAEVQKSAAAVALRRAKQLFADQAGTQRTVDEAQAAFDVAEQTAKAAQARKTLLAQAAGRSADGSGSPSVVVTSPLTGIVTAVRVAPGQFVSAGAPLFEVADLSQIWVRVSAGAAESGIIASDRPAIIWRLGMSQRNPADRGGISAQPTGAPPVGVSLTSTIDVTYKLSNPEADPFRPGERVAVALPLKDAEESLVLPWSAVVYDLHGGAWIYEATGPRQYVRRRVEVRYVEAGQAILRSGPPAGTKVVTQGVAELFGREMGFAK